jgi:hypothetical protein
VASGVEEVVVVGDGETVRPGPGCVWVDLHLWVIHPTRSGAGWWWQTGAVGVGRTFVVVVMGEEACLGDSVDTATGRSC